MKYVKTLGLAAVAAAALMAVLGAGMASATVICKNNLNTEKCSEPYPVGTEGTASLVESARLTDTTGEELDTCAESTIKSTLKEAGSATTTVKSGVSSMTFGLCAWTTTVINGGWAELHWIKGTDNGTLTTFETEVTISIPFFGSCRYGPGNGADVGTTVGGNPGSMTLNLIVKKLSGSSITCPETARFTGKYVATSPTNAWVAAG